MSIIKLTVNGTAHTVDIPDPTTPLLYVLRNDLGLEGPRFGCGLGQCGAGGDCFGQPGGIERTLAAEADARLGLAQSGGGLLEGLGGQPRRGGGGRSGQLAQAGQQGGRCGDAEEPD